MTSNGSVAVNIRIVCSIAVFITMLVLAASAQQVPSPSFLPAVFYGSGSGPAGSVAIADLNGDDKLDLVVADSSPDGAVGVLLGNGDGTFQPVVTYPSGGGDGLSGFYVSQAVVADVNGDGKPDVVVSNLCSPSDCFDGSVGILLGNGDGTFQPVVVYKIPGGASSLAVADVNRDGKPDLLVTIPSGAEVAVLLGNGDGTFQPPVTYGSGASDPTWVAVSDLNGDGKLDLVVGNVPYQNDALNVVGVLLGNGDGTFQPAVPYEPGGGPSNISIAIGDINGDGKPDIVVSEGVHSGGFLGPGSVDVLLGNGDGTFKPAVSYNSGGRGSGGIVLGDVNGDGKPDVIVANECPAEGIICGELQPGVVSVLLGNGDGTLQAAVTYVVGGFSGLFSNPLAVADLNGDGLIDVVAAECPETCDDERSNEVGILLHVGTTATTTTLTSTPNPSSFSQPITFTAIVTSGSGTPTGAVTFFNNSTVLGSATLANGRASISYSFLQTGSQSITAVFGGSVQFDSSTSAPLLQVVNPEVTATALVSSRNPAPPNAFVKYSATVTSQYGGSVSGTVAFKDGGIVVATVRLTSGVATYRTQYPTGGLHAITATYSGDADSLGSTSPILTEIIQAATSTTLLSSLNPSVYGQKVTWTATVTTGGSTPPTGKVNFNWSVFTLGTATLNSSGVATLTRSNTNADAYPLTAVYLGDANNLGSSSAILNQVVTQATSTTTLTSSPNPSTKGQTVTFTAKVTSPTTTPTGPVTFTAGKTTLGTVNLSSGKAIFSTSTLAVGSTTVTATYATNSDIAGSSTSVTQSVQQ